MIERRSIFSNSSAPPLSVTSLQRLTGDCLAVLNKLAELVELSRLSQSEDRARMEHTIQLVCWALQTVAWVGLRDWERGAPERGC